MALAVLGWTMVQKRVRWKHDGQGIHAFLVHQNKEVELLRCLGSRYPTVCVTIVASVTSVHQKLRNEYLEI